MYYVREVAVSRRFGLLDRSAAQRHRVRVALLEPSVIQLKIVMIIIENTGGLISRYKPSVLAPVERHMVVNHGQRGPVTMRLRPCVHVNVPRSVLVVSAAR